MNPATEEEAIDLASNLTKLLGEEVCDLDEDSDSCTEVVIFPPHPFLSKVKDVVEEASLPRHEVGLSRPSPEEEASEEVEDGSAVAL